MRMSKGKIVVVLGMHRSGTSAITEFVSSLGFNVPGDQLAVELEVNERGFWESQQVVNFNDELLAKLDLSWYSLRRFSNWDQLDSSYWSSMVDWLTSQLVSSNWLVIKDPRINVLLPIWKKILDSLDAEIFFINVNRHPDKVVQSINKRDGFGYTASYALWLHYIIKPFEFVLDRNCYFINYEQVLENKDVALDALANYLVSAHNGDFSVVESRLARNVTLVENYSEVALSARAVYDFLRQFNGIVLLDSVIAAQFMDNLALNYQLDDVSRAALGEVLHNLVSARRSMIDNGEAHLKALAVIAEKDEGLKENKEFIDKINGKLSLYECKTNEFFTGLNTLVNDSCLSDLETNYFILTDEKCNLSERFDGAYNLVKALVESIDNLKDLSHRDSVMLRDLTAELDRSRELLGLWTAERDGYDRYIDECHNRIGFLQSVIDDKTLGEEKNAAYIAECHEEIERLSSVIKNKDEAERHNKEYIETCHAEISRLMSVIAVKEDGEAHNANYIEQCHKRIVELEGLYTKAVDEIERLSNESLYKDKVITSKRATIEQYALKIDRLQSKCTDLRSSLDDFVHFLRRISPSLNLSDSHADKDCSVEWAVVLGDAEKRIHTLASDNDALNEKLNVSLTEFSVLKLRLEKLERGVALMKKNSLLAKINNKILNGL